MINCGSSIVVSILFLLPTFVISQTSNVNYQLIYSSGYCNNDDVAAGTVTDLEDCANVCAGANFPYFDYDSNSQNCNCGQVCPGFISCPGDSSCPTTINAYQVLPIAVFSGLGTFAGSGTKGDSGNTTVPVGDALMNTPWSIWGDDYEGVLYLSDSHNHRILQISDGEVSTFLGTGEPGSDLTHLNDPRGITGLPSSPVELFIADLRNYRVLLSIGGQSQILVAGTGIEGDTGDNGESEDAELFSPFALALDVGNLLLYIADIHKHVIRAVNIETSAIQLVYSAPAGSKPFALSLDSSGHLYVALFGSNSIIQLDSTTGDEVSAIGNGGTICDTNINHPSGVYVDSGGNIYWSEAGTSSVYVCSTTNGGSSGITQRIAGSGKAGFSATELNHPKGIWGNYYSSNIYIPDTGNHRVMMLQSAATPSDNDRRRQRRFLLKALDIKDHPSTASLSSSASAFSSSKSGYLRRAV